MTKSSKVYSKETILHGSHWTHEDFKQRITTEEWKHLLLNNDDNVVFKGRVCRLKAKRLGFGVVEVSKAKKGEVLK